MKEPGGESKAEGTRQRTDEPLNPVVKGVEERISQEATFAVHRGAGEPVTGKQLPHLAVAPLLKVEAVKRIAEVAGDIVRT